MDDNSLKRELFKYDTEGLYVTHLPEALREVFINQSRQKVCLLKQARKLQATLVRNYDSFAHRGKSVELLA